MNALRFLMSVVLSFSASPFGLAQHTETPEDSCLVAVYFNASENGLHIDTSHCTSIQDSLFAGATLHNVDVDALLLHHASLHFRYLEISHSRAKNLPNSVKDMRHLEELWLDYPNCRKIDPEFLHDADSIRDLRIIAKLNEVPSCFYFQGNLRKCSFIIQRSAQIDTTKALPKHLELLITNLKINANNAIGIAHAEPKELILMDQCKITDCFLLLKEIPTIRVYGKLSKKDKRRLLELLPQALFGGD